VKNRRQKNSLVEAFGYKEKSRKISLNELKHLVAELIKEEEEGSKPKASADSDALAHAPEHFKSPEMADTPADGTGNLVDIDAEEIVAQMLSGDPKAPVVVAMSAFHTPDLTPEFSDNVGSKEGAKDLQRWTLEKGPAYIANNIATVQRSLTSPEDSNSQVATASPDIDLDDPLLPIPDESPSSATWFEDQGQPETKQEAISRVALRLLEDASKPEVQKAAVTKQDPKDLALAFLAKGLKDGTEDSSGSVIDVSEDETINVAEMIPTQQDVQLGKSLAFAISGGFGPEDNGAYVTDTNEILDGHYRWAGTMITDPGASIKGQKISAPADDIIPALTALGTAFSNSSASKKEQKNESLKDRDDLIVERWQKLAGIIKG
tara:strand:+ start:745 stop:1875 length:1131 start_codon:yes stop_codon:yes gene_type:complete